jgi:hypothetical protein
VSVAMGRGLYCSDACECIVVEARSFSLMRCCNVTCHRGAFVVQPMKCLCYVGTPSHRGVGHSIAVMHDDLNALLSSVICTPYVASLTSFFCSYVIATHWVCVAYQHCLHRGRGWYFGSITVTHTLACIRMTHLPDTSTAPFASTLSV